MIVGGSAVKLDTTGEGPVGILFGVYTGPIKTTSKSDAVSVLSSSSSLLFHRSSGAPVMNIAPPLSATMSPYCFKAVRMTWSLGGKPEILKPAFNRSRIPIGGAFWLVSDDAQWDAGGVNACLVTGTVTRMA